MAGATFSDVESFGMLKELYGSDPELQENINSSLWNFINKNQDGVEFDGNYFNRPVQLQINESYAALNPDERLPEAELTKGVFAKFRAKLMYSKIEATTYAATRGHKNGRPNGKYLDDLMKGTLISFMANLDADLYGNGFGGRATILTATAAQTSFTVESSMQIRAGMKLDWYDSTLTTKRGSIKVAVKAVDRMNRRVYIDTTFGSAAVPAGAVAGDKLVVYNALAAGTPTDGRHIMGMARMIDNSLAVGGLDPADYAAWQAVVTAAGGGNPSQEILQQHWDHMYIISGKYPNRMVFNPAWKRAYLSQFLNQRRFNSNSFDTGASSLTFQPLKMGTDQKGTKPASFEMLEDKNCDPTLNYIWEYNAFNLATDYATEPHLADEDGTEMRIRPGYDSLEGFYRFWANTTIKRRNCIGAITGYATPSGVL